MRRCFELTIKVMKAFKDFIYICSINMIILLSISFTSCRSDSVKLIDSDTPNPVDTTIFLNTFPSNIYLELGKSVLIVNSMTRFSFIAVLDNNVNNSLIRLQIEYANNIIKTVDLNTKGIPQTYPLEYGYADIIQLKELNYIGNSFQILFTYNTNPIDNSEPVGKYYPLKIGNKWEYSFKTEGENSIIVREIRNNITHEDGSNIWGYTEALKVIDPDSNAPISSYYTLKSDGLYFYSSEKDTMISGTSILCKKQLILKSPVKIGTQWKTKEGDLCRIANISDYKVLDINYPNTVLVISEQNQNVDSSWYSLNVGLIKRVLNIGIRTQYPSTIKWELKKYILL